MIVETELRAGLNGAGIHPWGSVGARLFEQRLTRFFEREYRRWSGADAEPEHLGSSSFTGPMWEQTDTLMSRHYDEPAELFTCFLDRSFRAYSMAYYAEDPEGIRYSRLSLEEAQAAKFELICGRAGIRGGERILNIGCGFGSFETFVLDRFPDVTIVGLTPSATQADYLRRRADRPGDPLAGGQFRLHQGAFDSVPLDVLGAQSYDLVISIGLLEQVRNMKLALRKVADLLRPGGTTFHHFIVSKTLIPRFLDAATTLIGDYFPGGRIWPYGELLRHQEYFEPQASWFVNGLNYWRTLDEWHRRFWENMPQLYPRLLDEAGVRHWNDYFPLCKACFAPMDGTLFGNGQYLLRKK